ncbi:MAG: DUF2752 domain-containing protein [Mycobacterium sp.]|nr:DUF2752 domain-containing protein [Mycobacterium sp.]
MEPERASGRCRHRLRTAVGAGALLTGAVGYVGLVDPHRANSVYPHCPFKWLTGWNCPFCGGLRMTHDLLHGDLAAAVNDNLFTLAAVPILAGWLLTRRRGEEALPTAATVTIVIVAAAWTVLRNLPGFPLVPIVIGG